MAEFGTVKQDARLEAEGASPEEFDRDEAASAPDLEEEEGSGGPADGDPVEQATDAECEAEGEEPAPAPEPAPPPPPAPEEPRRRPRRSRTVSVPPAGEVRLQFDPMPRPRPVPPPAPPRRTPVAVYHEHRAQEREAWFRKLSKFAPDTIWYAKRIGPPFYRGRKSKLGVYSRPFTGPLSPEMITEVMGGGLISVTPDDPTSDEAQWYGPIELMWDDQSEKGLEPRQREESATSLPAESAGAPSRDDEEVTVVDPRLGVIKRRRADVERQAARAKDDAILEEMREARKEQHAFLEALVARLARPPGPEKSPMEDLLRLERERLEAEKTAKAEELRFLREKLEKDRVEAERQRKHDLEIAEKRFESERERLTSERAALEQRLETERRLAESKLEKAHTTMLEMVGNKTNTLENVSALISTFHEVQELLGGGAAAAPAETPAPKHPKSVGELVVDKLVSAADKIFPSVEPILQHAVRSYLDQTVAKGAPQPAVGVTSQPPAAALPAPAEASPGAAPEAPALDWGRAIGTVVADLDDGMSRNLPPRAVWESIRMTVPPVAEMLTAYGSVDKLVSELETIAAAPAFAGHADAIRAVARKAAGPSRKWAEQFLVVVRAVERPSGRAPAAPSSTGGDA